MSKKIFLIAGEPSGDVLGVGLIRALKTGDAAVECSGIGGPLMEKEGLKSLLPMNDLCVMGLIEVLGHLPRLLGLINRVVEEIEAQNPDAVVTIDLPDFNFQVARRLKKRGRCKARLIHYVAPTVWAWRAGRAKKIAKFLDGLLCLLPFEPPYFKKHGLTAEFVGHPIVELHRSAVDVKAFKSAHGIKKQQKTLGLFMGSRQGELQKHGSILRETVAFLAAQDQDLAIIVPTLPQLESSVRALVADWPGRVTVVSDPALKWSAFAACDAAVAVSGTVALELAYMNVPHIIAYKMNALSWLFVRLLVKVRYAHLVNILLERPAVPEFLQQACRSPALSKALLELLHDQSRRDVQKAAFKEVRARLTDKENSPSQKAASFILRQI